jgi:hypothetical protein
MKSLSKFKDEIITEANDYKRTRQYNKLTPVLKRAVDMVFTAADKDADAVANFDKNVRTAAKKYNVSVNDLMNYFDKETLTILKR